MSRYIVTPEGALAGYTAWPWDALYAPVVGVFVDGALCATATAELWRADAGYLIPRLPLRSRLKRRVLRELGRPMPPPVVPLQGVDGPPAPVWFRVNLEGDVADRLRRGDPAARVERLEDSAALLPEGAPADSEASGAGRRVEDLLIQPAATLQAPQDGFPHFVCAPAQHQLEVAFVEYLRRLPEEGARRNYLPQMEAGEMNIFQLRASILASEEFRARRIGLGSRLGAGLTTPLWSRLRGVPTLLDPYSSLRTLNLEAWSALSEEAFLTAACESALRRAPSPVEEAGFRAALAAGGRREAALRIATAGARLGRFVEVL